MGPTNRYAVVFPRLPKDARISFQFWLVLIDSACGDWPEWIHTWFYNYVSYQCKIIRSRMKCEKTSVWKQEKRAINTMLPGNKNPATLKIFLDGHTLTLNLNCYSRASSAAFISIVIPPGGALGYFLGGYVPPRTPKWHPVLEKISPKIDTPF